MKVNVDKFYNDLKQEAEVKLGRKLIEKERHFLRWMAERHVNEQKKG